MNTKILDRTLSRSDFLKYTGSAGAVFMLGYLFPIGGTNAILKNLSNDATFTADLTPFIIIDSSDNITLMLHKPEMGQGTYESMPVILAEELDVLLDQVHIKPAIASRE